MSILKYDASYISEKHYTGVQELRFVAPHRLDLDVDAELQHVHHERSGELHCGAVLEEDERAPQPELEDPALE